MKIIDLSHNVRSGMTQRFAGPIPTIFDHDVRKGKEYEAIDDCCVLQNHLGIDPTPVLAGSYVPVDVVA